ncbi:MAG: hypothetical protein ACR2LX_01145 [Jatrophihabitans sp.]
MSIGYQDVIGLTPHSATAVLPGPPPTYQPCTPVGFTAEWGATRADGVTIATVGGDLSRCGNWRYELLRPDGAICTPANGAPKAEPPAVIPIGDCGVHPVTGVWKVSITWTRPNGMDDNVMPVVGGKPPTT